MTMPRKKSDQVITHRIELGAWERENIGKPVAETAQAASAATSLGVVALGGGALLAAYCLYVAWDVIGDTAERVGDVATRAGNRSVPIGARQGLDVLFSLL